MSDWVSVKDGLPKMNERVLVRYLYSCNQTCDLVADWISVGSIYDEYQDPEWTVDSQSKLSAFTVTHWKRTKVMDFK